MTRALPTLCLLLLAACGDGNRYALLGAGRALEADGEIRLVSTDEGATEARIELDHLPPPDRILAGSTTYVIWLRGPDDEADHNAGALAYDITTRRAEGVVPAPLRPFTVRVTAEATSDVEVPGESVVAEAEVRRR